MDSSSIAQFPKFANLISELQAAEAAAFGSSLPSRVESAREQLIATLRGFRVPRLRLGLALLSYKDAVKTDHVWVRAAQALAEALHCSPNSLYTLINNSERANRLPEPLLASMIECRIDPAATRNTAFVEQLLQAKFAGSAEELRQAYDTYRSERAKKIQQNRLAEAESGALAARLLQQITQPLQSVPEDRRAALAQAILSQIAEALKTATATGQAPTAPTPHTMEPLAAQSASRSVTPALVRSASTNAISFASVAPQQKEPAAPLASIFGRSFCRRCESCQSAEEIRHRLIEGDDRFSAQALSVFSTYRDGPSVVFNGNSHCELSALRRIANDQSPKRFFIPHCGDLLCPDVQADVIREHFDIFRAAPWHIFQLRTSNGDRLEEINNEVLAAYGTWPSNVWMGVMVAEPKDVEQIGKLCHTSATVKWISFDHLTPTRTFRSLDKVLRKHRVDWAALGSLEDPEYLHRNRHLLARVIEWIQAAKIPLFAEAAEIRRRGLLLHRLSGEPRQVQPEELRQWPSTDSGGETRPLNLRLTLATQPPIDAAV